MLNTLVFLKQSIVIKEGGGSFTWYMLFQLHVPLVIDSYISINKIKKSLKTKGVHSLTLNNVDEWNIFKL
jgi:membrane protein CcdC involved in cytochrome C biogenesis